MKYINKLIIFALLLSFACNREPLYVLERGVSIHPTTFSLLVGSTETLTATVTPENATERHVVWNSSDNTIATVSNTGVVTGVSAGQATIRATTANGFQATSTVTVTNIPVPPTGIEINRENVVMFIDDEEQLLATVLPENATSRQVQWNSEDPAIATVSQTGLVRAVSTGVVTITVTTVEGDFVAHSEIRVLGEIPPLGFSFSPEEINADQELTILFRAGSGHDLFNYAGDTYLHTGVIVDGGPWQFVPAQWSQNIEKCRMARIRPNIWQLTMTPSIREWFGSGDTPVARLGFVVRSADGSRQTRPDVFVNVDDDLFEPFNPDPIIHSPMPAGLVHGINYTGPTSVTLVLYDRCRNGTFRDFAHVMGDFNDWTLSNTPQSQMFRDNAAGTWWITIDGLNPTNEYAFQYFIGFRNGEILRVADPFTRKILDPNYDRWLDPGAYAGNLTFPQGGVGIVSTFQIQRPTFQWSQASNNFEPPCLNTVVMYELLIRDFTDRGGVLGSGTFLSAIERLDYLADLGINAIKLMPVQEFEGNISWGYNPSFFFAIDKAYGGSQMFKRFVDEAHQRGIAVILDVVYNHATRSTPWVRMWWNYNLNRPAANNPFFNEVAPHYHGWFYDFDHESPLVTDFVKRNLQFLLQEYRVDGFRFDFSKGFTNRPSNSVWAESQHDPSRIAILNAYNNAILDVNPNAIVILEHFAEDREEIELSNNGMLMWRNMNWAFSQAGQGHSNDSDFSRTFHGNAPSRNRPANSLVSYMESHDEERIAFRQTQWGVGHLRNNLEAQMSQLATNAAFFFTVPGPKMIWQFGEFGFDISIDDFGGRTAPKPTRWNYLDVPARAQLHYTYTRLIGLRHDHPELFDPAGRLDWSVGATNWNNGRFLTLSAPLNTKQVVVVGNFTNAPINANTTFPRTGTWYNFMTGESKNVTSTTMSVEVPANSFRMFSTFAP